MSTSTVPLGNLVSSMCDSLQASNGLKICFNDIIDEYTTACQNVKGIAISKYANGRTLAHEIGHACGLPDIYPHHRDTTLSVTGETIKAWIPKDCSSEIEIGYYTPNLLQTNLLSRLLMNGYSSTNKSDISLGNVHGLWYRSRWNRLHRAWEKEYQMSLAPIGFDDKGPKNPSSR